MSTPPPQSSRSPPSPPPAPPPPPAAAAAAPSASARPSPPPPSAASLLTYPASTPPAPSTSTSAAAPAPPALRKERLYIGNLHPSVDEYTLLQLFTKHGRVAKLDFLFHRAGPAKGRPRGYAFVEYAAKEDALRALVALHDRLVRGRRLVVTFAHQAPPVDTAAPRAHRRAGTDTSRPTTLSLLKTHNRPAATKDKIALLEAKLRQMETPPHDDDDPDDPDGGTGSAKGKAPARPRGLPERPIGAPVVPSVDPGGAQRVVRRSGERGERAGEKEKGKAVSGSVSGSASAAAPVSNGAALKALLKRPEPQLKERAGVGTGLGRRQSSAALGVVIRR